jgi:hypothetical protein
MTAVRGALLSYFDMPGTVVYSPIFVQNVMRSNATSGRMMTLYTTLIAFLGVTDVYSSE